MAKRLSLSQQIDLIGKYDEVELAKLIKELEDDVKESVGFRWHARGTQAVQDHHLKLYLNFIKSTCGMSESDGKALDLAAFPIEFKVLVNSIQT